MSSGNIEINKLECVEQSSVEEKVDAVSPESVIEREPIYLIKLLSQMNLTGITQN